WAILPSVAMTGALLHARCTRSGASGATASRQQRSAQPSRAAPIRDHAWQVVVCQPLAELAPTEPARASTISGHRRRIDPWGLDGADSRDGACAAAAPPPAV